MIDRILRLELSLAMPALSLLALGITAFNVEHIHSSPAAQSVTTLGSWYEFVAANRDLLAESILPGMADGSALVVMALFSMPALTVLVAAEASALPKPVLVTQA